MSRLAAPYHTAPLYATPHRAISYHTTAHQATPHHAPPRPTTPHRAEPYHATLRRAMSLHTTPRCAEPRHHVFTARYGSGYTPLTCLATLQAADCRRLRRSRRWQSSSLHMSCAPDAPCPSAIYMLAQKVPPQYCSSSAPVAPPQPYCPWTTRWQNFSSNTPLSTHTHKHTSNVARVGPKEASPRSSMPWKMWICLNHFTVRYAPRRARYLPAIVRFWWMLFLTLGLTVRVRAVMAGTLNPSRRLGGGCCTNAITSSR